jgi:magnesium chelatase subunit D
MSEPARPLSVWERASYAGALFAVDTRSCGVRLRAGPGPARDAWLEALRNYLPERAQIRRVPLGIGDDRLLGGLDLSETLRLGRPIFDAGVVALADGGVLMFAMAERLSSATAARISNVMDTGEISVERDGLARRMPARFGVVALDEGLGEEERPPLALLDRLALCVDLDGLGHGAIGAPLFDRDEIARAKMLLPSIFAEDGVIEALVVIAAQLGVASLRAPLQALIVARAACALRGGERLDEADIAVAVRYVLAPRATRLPAGAEAEELDAEQQRTRTPPPQDQEKDSSLDMDRLDASSAQLEDLVLEAARAAVPKNLLALMEAGPTFRARAARVGKAGAIAPSSRRGRPIGAGPGALRDGRLGLIDTMRAAAPWQKIRRKMEAGADARRILMRPEDFRILRFRERRETTAIFVVDASGSSAMARLPEVKGAIELLLADCYVRRDSVAVVAFRGTTAEIVLPPTRSLTRAKRMLAGLPGGGGTPLACGLDAALTLAESVRRKGPSPLLVLMTDGRANICRNGASGRTQAMQDALLSGRQLRAAGISSLAIDTSPALQTQADPPVLLLAQAMDARYLKLPLVDAAHVSNAVRSVAQSR